MSKKDEYQMKSSILIVVIIGILFVIWLFWPTGNYTSFTFESENGERYDGKVYFDDVFIGSTQNGKIKVYEQEHIPSEMIFKGIYDSQEFEFVYDFPKDYLDYSEIPFLVEEEDILNYLEENKDNFSNITEKHWGHMPLTYRFENECVERQLNLTRLAFKQVGLETSFVVSFFETSKEPDISIYCKPRNINTRTGEGALADAVYSLSPSSENLIIKGEINIYGQGQICNTGYPALEVHEILHLFDIPHNPLKNSIMSPFSAESSNRCEITEIDPEYISCLRYIYSNGEFEGNCSFPNVIY